MSEPERKLPSIYVDGFKMRHFLKGRTFTRFHRDESGHVIIRPVKPDECHGSSMLVDSSDIQCLVFRVISPVPTMGLETNDVVLVRPAFDRVAPVGNIFAVEAVDIVHHWTAEELLESFAESLEP